MQIRVFSAIAILVWFTAFTAHAALPAGLCESVLATGEAVKALEGEKKTSVEGLTAFNRAYDIFELGSGIQGGTVYRLVKKDGSSSFVMKRYWTESFMDNDLRAFAILRGIQKYLGVRIARAWKVNDVWMRVEDIRGQTLEKVFQEGTLTEANRHELRETYMALLDSVHLILFDKYFFTQFRRHEIDLRAVIPTTPAETKIYVKLNNIVVQEGTGELVIIDPF